MGTVRHSIPAVALLAAVSALASCTDSNKGGVRSASFADDPRTPGAAQVFVTEADENGQNVTVAVRARELAAVAAADLTLEYDPVRLVYVGFASGSLLEQGPEAVAYAVGEQVPGLLRMQIARAAGTASAGPDEPVLVLLTFVVVARGITPVEFGAGSRLLDGAGQPIPGVAYFSGAFEGS